MQIPTRYRYMTLSDKELVNAITKTPPDEDAAVYLLFERYTPKFKKLYTGIYQDMSWYDDCMNDLFAYLKGKEHNWNTFRTFQWRSRFSTWIGQVARNRFLEIKPYLIGKIKSPLSIDDNENGKKPVVLPDEYQEDYERRERKVILLEAIGLLKDMDQKFVILKTLQGYNSGEIADMLTQKWQKEGITKYDNKGNLVTPTSGYVDVRRQRAKENLKRIIVEL